MWAWGTTGPLRGPHPETCTRGSGSVAVSASICLFLFIHSFCAPLRPEESAVNMTHGPTLKV